MPRNDSHSRLDRIRRKRSVSSLTDFKLLLSHYPRRVSVVSEGDSWFAYPRKHILFGKAGNIISHLKSMQQYNLLELASNGDEAVDMVCGDSKQRILDVITECRVDILLFSGGGNDLVGRYDFDFVLKPAGDRPAGSTEPSDYFRLDRLDRRFQQIELAYRELVDLAGEYSLNPDIRIIGHCYDYAIPSPQGAEFFGGLIKNDGGRSWMHPYMTDPRFAVPTAMQPKLVVYLMDRVHAILSQVAADSAGRFTLVDTRHAVRADQWLNEIHPTSDGFRAVAQRIYDAM